MHGLIIAMALVVAASTTAYAQDVKIVGEDILVSHGTGTQIFVRNGVRKACRLSGATASPS
jgi:hypothetical protein